MKRTDIVFALCLILLFLPFFLFNEVFSFYESFNKEHIMIMSFIKFAILATTGELLGLRLKKGVYFEKGFGVIPRAIVWGFLGLAIQMAFVIFSTGIPIFISKTLGFAFAADYLDKEKIQAMDFGLKLLVSFSISASMNIIFAPIMMTFHKITDTHIINNGGTLVGFFKPIQFGNIMSEMNWRVQWDFVFKKTIPFFWIPAHTITFMLPPEYRVLFAAILGIALGVIMAIASQKGQK
ncbi:MAG: Mpv17/PMP22 family protein [Bacteroidetes bacterium]|nr:Mpv17/PMP22 family protein [Bacteroidota bacterium]